MGSLGVLDVFCTVFECATTSRSKFKILSIFVIFRFFIFGLEYFDYRNFDNFSFVGTKKKKSKTISLVSFTLPMQGSFTIFPSVTYFLLFLTKSQNFICGTIIFFGPTNENSTVQKILPSKNMEPQLSNALSNEFIALLVPEISYFLCPELHPQ